MKKIKQISFEGAINDAVKVSMIQEADDKIIQTVWSSIKLTDLRAFLIEVYAHFDDMEPGMIASIVTEPSIHQELMELRTTLPGVKFKVDRDEIVTSMFSGDAKCDVVADGKSMLMAIGTLLRKNGFKSKAFNDDLTYTGKITINQWVEDFRYGFERRSDEQLQAELQGLLEPEIGAW